MKLKKLAAALGVALPLSLASVAVQAASVVMSFEDDDIDFLGTVTRDAQGQVTAWNPKVAGSFAQGDILFSVFEINSHSINPPGGSAIFPGKELTGIAAVEILNISGPAGGAKTITFGLASGVLDFFLTAVNNPLAGANAAVAMYMTTPNLDINFDSNPAGSCNSLLACVADATDGEKYQVDGFMGDPNEFWTASTIAGGDNVATVAGTAGDAGVALFNAALTTMFNLPGPIAYRDILTGAECAGPGPNCIAGPKITGPLTGGLGLNQGIRNDGAFARSDFDASKRMLVPEPGTLALTGLSLLGLAGIRRRRKQ